MKSFSRLNSVVPTNFMWNSIDESLHTLAQMIQPTFQSTSDLGFNSAKFIQKFPNFTQIRLDLLFVQFEIKIRYGINNISTR